MLYTALMVGALLALGLVLLLIFLVQERAAQPKEDVSTKAASNDPAVSTLIDSPTPGQASFSNQLSQQWFDSSNAVKLTGNGATRPTGNPHFTGPIREASPINNHIQSRPGFAAYAHPRHDSSPLPPPQHAYVQRRHELEQEYERGMRTIYDERVGAINFIGMHVVMNSPAEVEIAFHVCKRQIRQVLRAKGLEHAPTLTDIGGIVIGRDATAAWGQALKQYLEEMCIKVGKDTYLLAHYNSQAQRPNQDELQEKVRRIQFMTSAAINNFQSNIFDTREEAVAFLLRMREVYGV
jgi:hypothetical protein